MRSGTRSTSTREDGLTDAILECLTRSRTWHVFIPPKDRQSHNPRRIALLDEKGKGIEASVYVVLTSEPEPGKGPNERHIRLDEFRESSISVGLNPAGPTVLVGYDRASGVFVGFDVSRHLGAEGWDGRMRRGASVRFGEYILREALDNGFSFRRSPSGEVLAGIRPDRLHTYLPFAERIHRDGGKDENFSVLKRIGSMEEVDTVFLSYMGAPPWLIGFVDESNKDSFKDRVRAAYRNRCVLSDMRLGLFDAAHIYPKDCEDTSHLVCNGFLLQPTLHRAHDNALIFLVMCEDGTYQFHPNDKALKNAADKYGRDGLRDIERFLKKPLRKIPKAKHLRPDIRWIRKSYTHYDIEVMEHLHWKPEDEEKWRREKGLIK